jgi:AmmeMemoRadiSam system protein B
MLRKPAVAGQFYPADPEQLGAQLDRLIPRGQPKRTAIAILCPHAGYPYSGPTTGKVFARTEIPSRLVLLGVNHHGIGAPCAVFPSGRWATPLGEVEIDEDLAARILASSPYLEADAAAHRFEHSLEVEVPFLQRSRSDVRIVPILFASHDLGKLREIGEGIAKVLCQEQPGALMLASSDMNHYEDQETAERKDNLAIEAIQALDPERLMRVCDQEGITMCGVAPACVMLTAARVLGATEAELIDHTTSGEVTGDYASVVGYAGVRIN